jgi:hypothetical protein
MIKDMVSAGPGGLRAGGARPRRPLSALAGCAERGRGASYLLYLRDHRVVIATGMSLLDSLASYSCSPAPVSPPPYPRMHASGSSPVGEIGEISDLAPMPFPFLSRACLAKISLDEKKEREGEKQIIGKPPISPISLSAAVGGGCCRRWCQLFPANRRAALSRSAGDRSSLP